MFDKKSLLETIAALTGSSAGVDVGKIREALRVSRGSSSPTKKQRTRAQIVTARKREKLARRANRGAMQGKRSNKGR